jgi:hypothetical protein
MSIPQNHSTFSADSKALAQHLNKAILEIGLNFAFDHWNIAEDL